MEQPLRYGTFTDRRRKIGFILRSIVVSLAAVLGFRLQLQFLVIIRRDCHIVAACAGVTGLLSPSKQCTSMLKMTGDFVDSCVHESRQCLGVKREPAIGKRQAPRGGRTRSLEIKSLTLYRLS